MGKPRTVECRFFIPVRRDAEISDGKTHSTVSWSWLKDKLIEYFDGGSGDKSLWEGFWRSKTGKVITDDSRLFLIALPANQVGVLRLLLAQACEEFQQQTIYLSVGGYVEFIEPDRE